MSYVTANLKSLGAAVQNSFGIDTADYATQFDGLASHLADR